MKSKGFSAEKLTTSTTTDISLFLSIKWYENSNFCLVFKGSCLKQNNATYTPPSRINVFIDYELDIWSRDLNSDFTLKDCSFGRIKSAENADPNKHVVSGYGIGFHSCSEFSLPEGSVGKNVILFGVDMSSSVHIDNKKKDSLILGFGPTQGLDDTKLTAEVQYSINFASSNRKFCLSLHYNGSNNVLVVNATNKKV